MLIDQWIHIVEYYIFSFTELQFSSFNLAELRFMFKDQLERNCESIDPGESQLC